MNTLTEDQARAALISLCRKAAPAAFCTLSSMGLYILPLACALAQWCILPLRSNRDGEAALPLEPAFWGVAF